MKNSRSGEVNRVDIVLDNSGLELFADLALADLLVGKCGVKKVVFHGKVCIFLKFVSANLKFLGKLRILYKTKVLLYLM